MPADFPPWPRVYAFFARWRDTGLAAELHERLREAVRRTEGREEEPSAAVVDSQSVKAEEEFGGTAARRVRGLVGSRRSASARRAVCSLYGISASTRAATRARSARRVWTVFPRVRQPEPVSSRMPSSHLRSGQAGR
ncbi:hypothetical protein [Streptomyces sp. KR55]|uniref:hypothetical protein n=1 Tax=Streptomyces sp. KR55 TaxID=3457425 RepID=UPI003FD58023